MSKNTKKRGISIIGILVIIGLIILISWGLNYIITKDYVTVRTPTPAIPNNATRAPIATASSTPTSTPPQTTQTKPIATSTPVKSPAPTTPTKPVATEPTTPASSDLTVTFTDKGFSPSGLTIKKGQTVTFVNESSGKMWVAANPFPSSSEYPEFNAKSSTASGSSWSFTFDTSGVWFYHNHYSPAQGAKIVVNAR